jgi:hypothetical protein
MPTPSWLLHRGIRGKPDDDELGIRMAQRLSFGTHHSHKHQHSGRGPAHHVDHSTLAQGVPHIEHRQGHTRGKICFTCLWALCGEMCVV